MSDAATNSLIAEIWKKNQPVILERLAELDAAAKSAAEGVLSTEARKSAESTAHKLSGSLGMFGFHQGTEAARGMEQELQGESPSGSKLVDLAARLRESLDLAG